MLSKYASNKFMVRRGLFRTFDNVGVWLEFNVSEFQRGRSRCEFNGRLVLLELFTDWLAPNSNGPSGCDFIKIPLQPFITKLTQRKNQNRDDWPNFRRNLYFFPMVYHRRILKTSLACVYFVYNLAFNLLCK